MVVVLIVSISVSVAGVQGGPLVVGCQAAIGGRERIVDWGTGRSDGHHSHWDGVVRGGRGPL